MLQYNFSHFALENELPYNWDGMFCAAVASAGRLLLAPLAEGSITTVTSGAGAGALRICEADPPFACIGVVGEVFIVMFGDFYSI